MYLAGRCSRRHSIKEAISGVDSTSNQLAMTLLRLTLDATGSMDSKKGVEFNCEDVCLPLFGSPNRKAV